MSEPPQITGLGALELLPLWARAMARAAVSRGVRSANSPVGDICEGARRWLRRVKPQANHTGYVLVALLDGRHVSAASGGVSSEDQDSEPFTVSRRSSGATACRPARASRIVSPDHQA